MQTSIVLAFLAVAAALNLQEPDVSVEDTNNAVLNGKPIFYQIVMGSFPFRHQYKLWMASLRQVGKYDGTVVFVTDKPGCIELGLGEQFLGGNMTYSDKNVDVFPGTGKGQVHILKVKKPRSVRGIKMHKSKAWDNLQLAQIKHPVSSIIYTDTDVIIGRDLSSFMAYEKSLEKKQHTLALFPDTGGASWEGGNGQAGVHTGVVVMFPSKNSKACLKEWGQQLGGGSDDPSPIHHFGSSLMEIEEQAKQDQQLTGVDQQALNGARSCKHQGEGISRMPASFLILPDETHMKYGKKAEFVHITNTARWSQTSTETKKKYFHKWIGVSKDIDWDKKGACPREVWATPEYMERNKVKDPAKARALKIGKLADV